MYTITYYNKSITSRPYDDVDVIPDDEIGTYYAPIWPLIAVSRHDSGEVMYGYDGEWHDVPPAEEKEEGEKTKAAIVQIPSIGGDKTRRPHVIDVFAPGGKLDPHDPYAISVRIPGRVKPRTISYHELQEAASQDDGELGAIYSELLREVDDMLDLH